MKENDIIFKAVADERRRTGAAHEKIIARINRVLKRVEGEQAVVDFTMSLKDL